MVQSIGGTIKESDLKGRIIEENESVSPERKKLDKKDYKIKKEKSEGDIKLTGPTVNINKGEFDLNEQDVKGGLKGFFKGIGGKIKAPEVHIPELNIREPKLDTSDIKIDGTKPNIDFEITGPKKKSQE